VNALVEVSAVGALQATEAYHQGALGMLVAPPQMVLGALVVFTALRANPRLSLMSGLLAAAQFLVIVSFWEVGEVPPSVRSLLGPGPILSRVVLLVLAGAGGAVVARHLVARAEAALRAVREQDLMGKYFLHEKLGAGGMAEVYRATYSPEGGFKKTVAIKRVLPARSDTERFTRMFLEEARLCALLNHPNVVQVFDCGRYQDRFILAMEYVDGCALSRLVKGRDNPLPLPAVTYVGAELAAALDYIHARVGQDGAPLRLVHRDLNPPNVLVSRIGEVKLADFGVAHVLRGEGPNEPGPLYGKVHYLAPEQLRGEAFDGRADLFCLGLVLHELLTGTRAVRGDTVQVMERPERLVTFPPSRLRAEVPPELDALVMALLEESPDRRPPTGAVVRDALLALPAAIAPYPAGQRLLAEAVRELVSAAPAPSAAAANAASPSGPGSDAPELTDTITDPSQAADEPTAETTPVRRAG
jgi:serine/threonine-protein kinase